MSGNRKVFNDWIDTLEDNLMNESESLAKEHKTGPRKLFYNYFDTSIKSYDSIDYTISMPLDKHNLPSGYGIIKRKKSWVWPKLSGFTSWEALKRCSRLHSMEGTFVEGMPNGLVTLTYCNGVRFQTIFHAGVPYGLVLGHFKQMIIWVGRWIEGETVESVCSVEPDGGCILTGETQNGENTGPDMVFLYPDLVTGLRGQWQDGTMIKAREVTVNCIDILNDKIRLSCSSMTGPEFEFAPSGAKDFGISDPLIEDPYEQKYIFVRDSEMESGGQGVYAKENLPKGVIAAVFNGFRIALGSGCNLTEGITEEEKVYERLSYNIHMPEDEDFFIDLPPEKADLKVYCGSLGHKVNHSFLPNCMFGTMYHPRWGRVRTVETIKEVKMGQELLVDYGYDLMRSPEWYKALWTKELGKDGKKYWEVIKKS